MLDTVAGADEGKKIAEAQKKGVEVWDEAEFTASLDAGILHRRRPKRRLKKKGGRGATTTTTTTTTTTIQASMRRRRQREP